MEDEFIFLLGLVALVCCHTPTFRNEATHPLKAPTESTLGLQMNEETIGRTKSNPSKAEPYLTGGKHFEYLLLNDSNVLLTSLQNDNMDAGAAQKTGSENDTVSRKANLNFHSHIKAKFDSTTKPPRLMWGKTINKLPDQSEWNINYYDTKIRSPYYKVYGKLGKSQSALYPMERGKISSTTKLYSRQANWKTENFATFTSPVAANKVQIDSRKNELVAPSDPQPAQSKMAQTAAPNLQKQSYDYDDSFTKLLISNGILKPDNKNTAQTSQDAVPFKSVLHTQQAKSDTNPSAEDISRIMDGNIGELTRNDSLSRILKSPPGQIAESILREEEKEISSEPTDTSTQQAVNLNSPSNTNKSDLSLVQYSSISKVDTSSEATNFSATDLKLNNDIVPAFSTNAVFPSAFPLEELTTVMPLDSNITTISDSAPTIDTSLSTSTPADKSVIHLEKRLIKKYETTSPAKTISSDQFVRTDQSNENPLSAKAYTDTVSNTESETEDSSLANQSSFQKAEEDSEDNRSRLFPVLNRFLVDYQGLDLGKSLPPTGRPLLPPQSQALTLEQHVLSVSEFKGLVEECVRQLFYFIARFIREQNMLSTEMLLENSSSNNRVTLKRFGFLGVAQVFNAKGKDFNEYDFGSWTDVADSSYKKVNVPLNKLFDDNDNENARWVVFASTDAYPYDQLRFGILRAEDYTLAARLSLEYGGLKINAIIILPSEVATNVTLPERDESSIDVNEELLIEEPMVSATNLELELDVGHYRVLQLFSKYSQEWVNSQASKMRMVDFEYQHEDVEFYIFVLGGAVCIFSILSPILYGIYRIIYIHRMHSSSSTTSFRLPSIFRRDKFQYQQSHEKMPESRCESLNVIFSEEFDKKYSSWFDNTHHSSSMLKATADGGSTSTGLYNDDSLDDYPEFSDLTRNVCENNSPRLSKENRLNMGCRPACVLLPHPATYLMQNEKDERYFDNPNYSR